MGNVSERGWGRGAHALCQPVPPTRRYAATQIGRHDFTVLKGAGRVTTLDVRPSPDRHQRSAVVACCLSGRSKLTVHAPGDIAQRYMRRGSIVTVRTPPDCAGGFVHQELVFDLRGTDPTVEEERSMVLFMSFVMAPPEGRPEREPWVSPTRAVVPMPELTNDQESHICHLFDGLGPGGEDDTALVHFRGRRAFELLEPLAPQDGYLIACIQGSVDIHIADPSDGDEASPVRYRVGGPDAETEGAATAEGDLSASIAFYFVPGSVVMPGPDEIILESGERKKVGDAVVLIRSVQCSDLGLD